MAITPTPHLRSSHRHHYLGHSQHPLPHRPPPNQQQANRPPPYTRSNRAASYVAPPNLGLQEAQSQILLFLLAIPDTSEAYSPQRQNNRDTSPQAPDVNPDHGSTTADTTNQWLEQQVQLLHQEVTTLNAMTTRLAPPPIIPIPPASPKPLPPLSPRYQPFQAWDDDHINWDDLEWKEDKYCGQVYCYAITGPNHARRFVGISRENRRCFTNSKRQLARLIFEGQALAFTMSGV
ncbi:hypothetical protein AMATHDRAFT_11091 [Amanita thiersii Skay4041]|uniref:Uncharacterized protein n=1 Tax=Amanita thiersii Skay4041 TaxID=703135 RepID=A0A2A9NAR5_9AGAR|nr:hypothetical protein AMATHDRAFT_11091 [Amanita thiersii Skay4041]